MEQLLLMNNQYSQPDDVVEFEENTELAEQSFEDDQSYDWTKYTASKKGNSMGDIFITQCIFCLVIIIAAIVMNIIQPDITDKAAQVIKTQLEKPFEFSDEIEAIFSQIRGLL